METQEFGGVADDSNVTTHRARARNLLGQIAEQAKQTLADAGIDVPLFFLVPSSGEAILTFGTLSDPDDDQWEQVSEIVSEVVGQTVGLDRVRTRSLACSATTESAAGHERPSESSPEDWPDGNPPMPIPALPAGAEAQ